MANFKEGDIVYHKATEQRGVIAGVESIAGKVKYRITWADEKRSLSTEGELYSEKEWEEHNKPMSSRDE